MEVIINDCNSACIACISRNNVKGIHIKFNNNNGQVVILCQKCREQLINALMEGKQMEENQNENN